MMLGINEATKIGTAGEWRIGIMSKDEIAYFWKEIEEALDAQPELWNGYYTKASIIDGLSRDELHMLAASNDGETINLITMCGVAKYPACKRLQVFWMYGEGLEEAALLMDNVLETFAEMTECKHIDGFGRRGYERILKPYGYAFARIHITKAVRPAGVRH